ncbi:MAG TPA: (Fe-S)-binding protein [Ktedonobacterales bacterium]|nr:(Fe-S)-binding protein [Ktedonobacterales bacterium]
MGAPTASDAEKNAPSGVSGETALTARLFGAARGALPGFTGPDQPREDILRACVRCGYCLPSCPTYLETFSEVSSPRGRIRLIQAVADGVLSVTDPGFVEQMYQCLDCRACEAVCPSGVRYGQLVETARTQIERARGQSTGRSGAARAGWRRIARAAALDGVFGDLSRVRLAGSAMRLYQRSGAQQLARATGALDALGLRDAEAMLPGLSAAAIIPRDDVYPPLPGVERRGRIALLTGCIMGSVFPETDRATIRVLCANGYEVVTPAAQQCCGALAVHSGDLDRARMLACRNIAAFEASGADLVISNAAGCGSALKDYGEFLARDPAWAERANAFAARVRDATEPLADLLRRGQLNISFARTPLRVTYQEPCHLVHAQRITAQPRALLRAIPGVELIEMQESSVCCGSAGVYNLLRPEMAGALGARKARNTLAASAQAVVTANPGCALQLRAELNRAGSALPVLHIMDLLDAAYRGRDPLLAAL